MQENASQPRGVEEPDTIRGPYLVVSAGPDRGEIFPLWGERTTIGRASRDATWEVRLTDRAVSRPHAQLERTESGYLLLDLNSANGTQLNDVPVEHPLSLHNGDVISVGETRLVFHER